MSNVKVSHIERWLLLQEGELRCAWCATPLTIESASRDHLIPRGRGGRIGGANIVPACEPCNRERGCQRLDQWLDRVVRQHGAIPESTRRMLLLFTIDFYNRRRQHRVTVEFLHGLPTVADVMVPLEDIGVRYRQLEQRRCEQIRREIAAKREARTMVTV